MTSENSPVVSSFDGQHCSDSRIPQLLRARGLTTLSAVKEFLRKKGQVEVVALRAELGAAGCRWLSNHGVT